MVGYCHHGIDSFRYATDVWQINNLGLCPKLSGSGGAVKADAHGKAAAHRRLRLPSKQKTAFDFGTARARSDPWALALRNLAAIINLDDRLPGDSEIVGWSRMNSNAACSFGE
jgi:hypothetical protein